MARGTPPVPPPGVRKYEGLADVRWKHHPTYSSLCPPPPRGPHGEMWGL